MRKASNETQGFGKVLGGALKAGALAAAAGVGIAAVAVDKFAKAAIAEQVVDTRMVAQLKALGVNYKAHADHISDVIDKEEKLSGFTKEDLVTSFTALARVTKGDVNKALEDNALAADIARGKGIDLASAQATVTKASLGLVGALRRQGLDVHAVTTATDALRDSHGKVTQAMKDTAKATDLAATKASLLATLQKKFSGQAETYGKTAAGAMDRFHNAIHDTEVALGATLLPVIAKVGGAAADMLAKIGDKLGAAHGFKAKLEVVWTGLQEAASKLVAAITGAMQQVDWSATGRAIVAGVEQGLSQAKDIAARLQAILSQAMNNINWEQVGTTVGPAIAAGLLAGAATLTDLGFWTRHWQEMLAVALAAVPFGKLASIGGKIVAELVRPVADLLGPSLGRAIGAAGDATLAIAERLGPRLGSIFLDAVLLAGRTFARLPGAISGAIGDLGGFVAGKLGSFKTLFIKALAFDAIIHAVAAGLTQLGNTISGWAGSAYAYAFNIGRAIVNGVVGGLGDLLGRVGAAIHHGISGAVSWAGGALKGSGDYMFTIAAVGKPLAEWIIQGFLLGSASLPSTISATIRNALEAEKATIDAGRATLQASWGNVTSDIDSAFDAVNAKIQTKTEKLIAAQEAARNMAQLKDTLKTTQADLGTAMASGDPAAIKAAFQAEQDAEFQIKLVGEQKKAAQERLDLDASTALKKRHLDDALATLQTNLGKQGASHEVAQIKIIALLNSYGINYKKSGLALGNAFATGLEESIDAAVAAAKKLAAAVDRYMPHSPAKEGPLSKLPNWDALMPTFDTGAAKGAMGVALAGAGGGGGRGGGGGMTINFQPGAIQGFVGDRNALANEIIRLLQQHAASGPAGSPFRTY
jgi:hypothetical protein